MKAIVAVTEDWGIGKDNGLLVSIPEDMKFFRETTAGGVVIMGRKTLESFPGGRPLKNRVNIVITKAEDYAPEGATVVHSVDEAVKAAKECGNEKVFVIGGASVYAQMVHLCDTVYVTKVAARPEADAFFPNLDEDPMFYISHASEVKEHEGTTFRFLTYSKI